MRIFLEEFQNLFVILFLKTVDEVIFDEVILEIVEEIVMLLVEMQKKSLIEKIPTENNDRRGKSKGDQRLTKDSMS
jgi:hypothetical protein